MRGYGTRQCIEIVAALEQGNDLPARVPVGEIQKLLGTKYLPEVPADGLTLTYSP